MCSVHWTLSVSVSPSLCLPLCLFYVLSFLGTQPNACGLWLKQFPEYSKPLGEPKSDMVATKATWPGATCDTSNKGNASGCTFASHLCNLRCVCICSISLVLQGVVCSLRTSSQHCVLRHAHHRVVWVCVCLCACCCCYPRALISSRYACTTPHNTTRRNVVRFVHEGVCLRHQSLCWPVLAP